MTKRTWSRVRNLLLAVTASTFLFVAVVGFAHTKAGRSLRPLLALLQGAAPGACPLGYGRAATPREREVARQEFARTHAGGAVATARPALGFVLDATTRSDVLAWARANRVTCESTPGGHDLECTNVREALLPRAVRGARVSSLWLDFGEGQRLLTVTAVRRDASAAAVSAAFTAVTRDLSVEAGEPTSSSGDASQAGLEAGLLRQASAEYLFRNYYALARATNMGDGFLLTEVYRYLGS